MADRPRLHVLVYSDFGGGKTTFAASFPAPIVVVQWDPYGKEMPYRKLARTVGGSVEEALDANGTPVVRVLGPERDLLVQVEMYVDSDMQAPEAYSRWLRRKPELIDEVRAGIWETVVWDSVTFSELAARKYHQYVLNAAARDPRQWHGGSTDLIEEAILGTMAGLPCNVVVIAHVDRDKDDVHGTMVHMPGMPGRRLFKSAPAAYAEVYHAYIGKGPRGEPVYLLQTRGDGMYPAATQIDAPDPCEQRYEALWVNWDAS